MPFCKVNGRSIWDPRSEPTKNEKKPSEAKEAEAKEAEAKEAEAKASKPAKSFLKSADGKNLKFALATLAIAVVIDLVIESIISLQENQGNIYISAAKWADIMSVQWELIFLGLGALVGAVYSTPQRQIRREASEHMLGPFVAVLAAVVVIFLFYVAWPAILHLSSWAALWQRVLATDAIGLGIIYYCVDKAQKIRK
jgi:hypothetical protein